MRFVLPSLLGFAASAVAAGSAIVYNTSNNTVYLWVVGSSVGPRQTVVPRGGLYMEPIIHDEKTGGMALKLTTTPDGLYNGSPQQVFAYTLDGAQVWYDLSAVFGEPFAGQRLEVTSTTGGSIVWKNGTNPGGSQVKVTPSSENIWFTIYSTPGV